MSTFDGEDFIKLDNDALGDGTSGDTYNVDVFTQQRFVSNQQYMAQGLDGACLTYEIDLGNSFDRDSDQYRPFATYQRASFIKIPWYLQTGLSQINVGGGYSVRNAIGGPSSQENVLGSIELLQKNEVIASQDVTFSNTYNGGSGKPCDINDFQFTLSLDDDYQDSAQWGELRFFIESNEGEIWNTYDNLNAERVEISSGVFITVDSDRFTLTNSSTLSGVSWSFPSNGPTSGSWVNKFGTYNGQAYDFLGGDFSSGNDVIWPEPITLDRDVNISMVVRDMSMFHPRYIQFEPKYSKSSLFTPEKEELKAQQPILGRTTTALPASLSRMHKRLRLIGLGPSGNQVNQDEQWSNGFRRYWNNVIVGVGNTDPFIDQGITVDKQTSSDVYIAFYVIAWIDSTYDKVGNYEVEYTGELLQLENGDANWTNATSINTATTTIPQIVYPARSEQFAANSPMLRTLMFSDENGAPSFKDGLIYDRDQDRLTLVVVKIPTGTTVASFESPMRAQVRASFSAIEPVERNTGNSINLTCVGYSIWEGGRI
jgi:hypothetical protein